MMLFRLRVLLVMPFAWIVIPVLFAWDQRREIWAEIRLFYSLVLKAIRKGGPV